MSANPLSSERPLRVRILIVPVLLILGLLGTAAFTSALVAEQRAVGDVVDIAGRQRMLNQRVVKEALLLQQGVEVDLEATRSLLDASLVALLEGGEAVTNPASGATTELPPAPEHIRPLLTAQAEELDRLYLAVDGFLAGTSDSGPLLEASQAVHTAANDAVQAFGADGRAQADAAVQRVIVVAGLLAAVGAALAWIVGRSLNGVVSLRSDQLDAASEELASVSTQVGANAEETSAQANVVAAAGEQVSANVQTVATAVDELSASVREIAQSSSQASQVASRALDEANDTNVKVERLGVSSAEIGEVIEVITSIAEQTNLLALNATIEAARAGEAGKGFAVVAGEVKELAKQTGKATEQISAKIAAIQGDSTEAAQAIAGITMVIEQISDMQTTIASAVEEQTSTTDEIARSVTEAATGSAQIAENITSVATAAADTSAGASRTQQAAGELREVAVALQELVDGKRRSTTTEEHRPERPTRTVVAVAG